MSDFQKYLQYKGQEEKPEETKYPVIEVSVTDFKTGAVYIVGPCCFHDLLAETPGGFLDHELAGMGVAIIGNFVQGVKSGEIHQDWVPNIYLKTAENAEPIPLPWPGMPNDQIVPLDPEKLPFDTAMFIGPDGSKKRIDRVALLDRIMFNWVPHLKSKVIFHA